MKRAHLPGLVRSPHLQGASQGGYGLDMVHEPPGGAGRRTPAAACALLVSEPRAPAVGLLRAPEVLTMTGMGHHAGTPRVGHRRAVSRDQQDQAANIVQKLIATKGALKSELGHGHQGRSDPAGQLVVATRSTRERGNPREPRLRGTWVIGRWDALLLPLAAEPFSRRPRSTQPCPHRSLRPVQTMSAPFDSA